MPPAMRRSLLILFLGVSQTGYAQGPARECAVDAEQPLILRRFSELGYPKEFTRERFEGLLQRFADEVHLKGFRCIGEYDDLFHGHILFTKNNPRAAALLYHTQEGAFDTRDYLDPAARNWIQWLDSEKPIENANKYVRKAGASYPGSGWDWRVYRDHFTIGGRLLDPESMGGEVERNVQWDFLNVDCGGVPRPIPSDSNVIEITLKDQGTVCLWMDSFLEVKDP